MLEADIIVTATGFNLNVLGDIAFSIDGEPLVFSDTVTYRGMMFTGVPNMAWVFGYFRASWTLRADLVADFVCRLLNHMKAKGARMVTPALRPEDEDMPLLPWIDPENFNPGYLMRGMHLLPKRGDKPEWQHTQDYWTEKDAFPADRPRRRVLRLRIGQFGYWLRSRGMDGAGREFRSQGDNRGTATMAIQNRLTRVLGIEHPVLLAPMDLVSGGRLAAAVSQAGGLGLLGGGYGDDGWIEQEWARADNARIGCGFITWSLAKRPGVLHGVLAHAPAAVMLSFGDPRPFAPAIHAAGARLICQVQTVAQAREAAEAGADVIVAQGTEAGGHGQSEPLFTLLPQVVDACPDTPVAAAGGIADGRGLAAAMMFGAEGVLLGTRFYASQEAEGHPRPSGASSRRRAGRPSARSSSTCRAAIAGPIPIPAACCATPHLERWLGREAELEAQAEEVGRDYAAARERGDFDVAGVIAGEACALIHDIPPAARIVERIVAEAVEFASRRLGGAG